MQHLRASKSSQASLSHRHSPQRGPFGEIATQDHHYALEVYCRLKHSKAPIMAELPEKIVSHTARIVGIDESRIMPPRTEKITTTDSTAVATSGESEPNPKAKVERAKVKHKVDLRTRRGSSGPIKFGISRNESISSSPLRSRMRTVSEVGRM